MIRYVQPELNLPMTFGMATVLPILNFCPGLTLTPKPKPEVLTSAWPAHYSLLESVQLWHGWRCPQLSQSLLEL